MIIEDFYDLYDLNTDIPVPDDLHFEIPQQAQYTPLDNLFTSVEFQNQNLPEDTPLKLTAEDNQWVTAKMIDPEFNLPAPSVAAERAAEKHLRNSVGTPYDFVMPVAQEQWQNFVMYRYYQLANDPDPKLAKSALDSLAKTNIVNLSAEKTEVNINMKSTKDLDDYLLEAFNKYLGKAIEGEAVRV